MFYEYALEPAVISSWDRARFFLDAFGPTKGRFLAEYPRKWKRMVFEGLKCQGKEKLMIIERLHQLDRRGFSPRSGAPYDPEKTWLANAERDHQRQAFRAIIALLGGPSGKAHIVDQSEADDLHPRWRVETGQIVPREPEAFAQALKLLLDASKQVVLIDPYFRADQDDKTRPLVAFCELVYGRASVEVHFADEPSGYATCMTHAARALPKVIPEGMKVTLRCLKPKVGGPRLHNRYLLTEVGGVEFGDGIERGDPGQEDRLSILDRSSHSRLWDQYAGSAPAFELVGTAQEFVGGDAKPRVK